MHSRINLIQSVRQYSGGVHSVVKGSAVGVDIHSVCQSAYDQSVWAQLAQVAYEIAAQVLAVFRNVACTHYAYHLQAVQVGLSQIVEQDGGIRAFAQPGRVGIIVYAQALDVAFLCKFKFFLSPWQKCVQPGQCFGQCGAGIRQGVKYVVAVFKHGRGASQCIDQKALVDQIDARSPGEGHGIEGFLCVHSSFMK